MHDVSIFWSSVESSRPVGVSPVSSARLRNIVVVEVEVEVVEARAVNVLLSVCV